MVGDDSQQRFQWISGASFTQQWPLWNPRLRCWQSCSMISWATKRVWHRGPLGYLTCNYDNTVDKGESEDGAQQKDGVEDGVVAQENKDPTVGVEDWSSRNQARLEESNHWISFVYKRAFEVWQGFVVATKFGQSALSHTASGIKVIRYNLNVVPRDQCHSSLCLCFYCIAFRVAIDVLTLGYALHSSSPWQRGICQLHFHLEEILNSKPQVFVYMAVCVGVFTTS